MYTCTHMHVKHTFSGVSNEIQRCSLTWQVSTERRARTSHGPAAAGLHRRRQTTQTANHPAWRQSCQILDHVNKGPIKKTV